MANPRNILKRRKAVGNIRTITKTMEMISTARFRAAHRKAVDQRLFTERSAYMVADVIGRTDPDKKLHHPLIDGPADLRRDALLVLTSNRGLCGGYNSSVLRVAIERYRQLVNEDYQVALYVVGKKGAAGLRREGLEVAEEFSEFDHVPSFVEVSALASRFIEMLLRSEIGGWEVVYTQFVSSARQRPVVAQMLPLSYLQPPPRGPETEGEVLRSYEFMPSAGILDQLLPASVRVRLYQCFLDAGASEQVARMSWMRAATENADEIIHDLTRYYNRQRQAQITNELAEIIGGAGGVASGR